MHFQFQFQCVCACKKNLFAYSVFSPFIQFISYIIKNNLSLCMRVKLYNNLSDQYYYYELNMIWIVLICEVNIHIFFSTFIRFLLFMYSYMCIVGFVCILFANEPTKTWPQRTHSDSPYAIIWIFQFNPNEIGILMSEQCTPQISLYFQISINRGILNWIEFESINQLNVQRMWINNRK